jgi:hypothetical protein
LDDLPRIALVLREAGKGAIEMARAGDAIASDVTMPRAALDRPADAAQ